MRTYKQVVKELKNVRIELKHAQEVDISQHKTIIELNRKLQDLNAEERRLTDFNVRVQLENRQLQSQRDAVIAALADCQRRNHVLRMKLRPCSHGCGSGINEDTDQTGLPLTDKAAEEL